MNDKDLTRQYRIQQWSAAIKDQKASGLTIDQWCKEHEVSRYQFFYRQKVVRKTLAAKLEKDMQTKSCIPAQSDCTPAVIPETGQQVSFVALPAAAMLKSDGIAMKIQCGEAVIIEVSNDASDRVLSLLREVILHAK